MRYFHKNCVFSLMAMLVAAPFIASANEIFPTSEYVVPIYQATVSSGSVTSYNEDYVMQVNSQGYVQRRAPVTDIRETSSTDNNKLTTREAVVDYSEDKDNKLDGGTNNTISDAVNSQTPSDATTKYTSAAAVAEYAIQKPADAANGKVLTYTGNADSRPTAQYIKVPMANGDPTANGTTVSNTASIWLQ